jgi:5'-AMP-activated protein kinase regulatory gamma subunit
MPADIQCRDINQYLTGRVRDRGIGTYINPTHDKAKKNPFYPLATATLDTTVFDVVHMFSERGISAVPIVDSSGRVINIYETVDVIVCPISTVQCKLD